MSKSLGTLPYSKYRHSIATGEIGSSQVKRIVLDSAQNLEVGDLVSWSLPSIQADEAASHLGRSANLTGNVESAETDDAYLQQINNLLRLHFLGAKTIFKRGDKIALPTVIDWSSATGKVEAWSLSTDYQLLSRAPIVTTTSPLTANKTKSVTSAKVASKIPQAKTVPTVTPSNPISVDEAVVVGAAQTKNQIDNRQAISMSVISLIAGLLSFRGRRFRRFVAS